MKRSTTFLLWMVLLNANIYAASDPIHELVRYTGRVGSIRSFTLVDPVSGNDIRTLMEKDTIFAGVPYNIRINSEGRVQSVIVVTTCEGGREVRFDDTLPFTVAGDSNGNYATWLPDVSVYTITAIPFKHVRPIGKKGEQLSIHLTVLPEPIPETKFILVNAITNEDIMELSDGDVLNLDSLPSKRLNIRADVGWQLVESVKFGFNQNDNFRVENEPPYALYGDTDGDYVPWAPDTGAYTIKAAAYPADNATGAEGPSRAIAFTVTGTPWEPTFTSYTELK